MSNSTGERLIIKFSLHWRIKTIKNFVFIDEQTHVNSNQLANNLDFYWWIMTNNLAKKFDFKLINKKNYIANEIGSHVWVDITDLTNISSKQLITTCLSGSPGIVVNSWLVIKQLHPAPRFMYTNDLTISH